MAETRLKKKRGTSAKLNDQANSFTGILRCFSLFHLYFFYAGRLPDNFIYKCCYLRQTVAFVHSFSLLLFLVGSGKRVTAQKTAAPQQFLFSSNKNILPAATAKQTYDEDAKSWYAVYTAGSTVHVYLAITDPEQQKKVIMNGIELWFDSKGKKNKKTGILFPFMDASNKHGPAGDTNRPELFNGHETDTVNMQALATAIASQHEMKLTGFKEDLNGIQNIYHPSGDRSCVVFQKRHPYL